MKGARSFGIALFFILFACKKPEPVQQTAPTETGPIVAASTAPSATVEPIASASSAPSAAESAAPREHSQAELEAEKTAMRKRALEEAREFGMMGLLGAVDAGDLGPGGFGAPGGPGIIGRSHFGGTSRAPSVRQGSITVNGRLPPEVIQRIVRQHFGRFRLCYETGLKLNPQLQGRVSTKFIIDQTGSVKSTQDAGSDMPDQTVVQCVVHAFGNLSYPQPEGGIVTVVFPLIFSPPSP